ncbi:class II aldolase and adducin N-terminal domain-containing protein [Sulfurimonas sp. HSL-3221]|uniref:Class II aldolase and adducin N-terminal domain-containing protein n=1 Tax=Sulfurimonas diazotrophicus TaxID=3131939 RepID=A0ABZ3HCA8_9BACT|nr:class II aldolase and adducin N-terminal domain-containing protein [Sulfurimonas sp. HSL-3221]UFS63435.1 class II aldolase and adducin N-terminal domain-containing protein [Sulfurimonas sp. HSL-3221]
MNKQHLKEQLVSFSLSMFRKEFFSIYHGSVSAKSDNSRFIINTKDTIFDHMNDSQLIELYFQKDYRWNEASIDAAIHHSIYRQISDAKFITFSMPPNTMAYSLLHEVIEPQDYFGIKEMPRVEVYDPRSFDQWYERASTEIPKRLINSDLELVVIRGYGIYAYNRDLHEMAKQLAVLEKSCRILMLRQSMLS